MACVLATTNPCQGRKAADQGERELISPPQRRQPVTVLRGAHGAIMRIYEKKPLIADRCGELPQGDISRREAPC